MEYPRSLMGSMALIRQTIADVRWYQSNKNKKNFNLVSEKPVMDQALTNLINPNQHYLFATDNLNDQLRAGHLLNELQLSGALLGNGREYARISELKKLQHPVIIPLNYPKAPNVSDSANENALSLAKMRHWERAPGNAASLSAAGIPFALTLHDIDAKQFIPRLRQAISHGLAKDTALAALTTEAAKIAGISDIAGQLKPGMMADFIVVKGDIFTNGQIHQVWLQGNQHELIPSVITNKTGITNLCFLTGKLCFSVWKPINSVAKSARHSHSTIPTLKRRSHQGLLRSHSKLLVAINSVSVPH
ncbi:hypothetical protein NFHSH190041_11430 [Shewanella sp. NFH-SH190041]|nr:hypothetical protein NFHSH190041_11430 [Shewanella sp. NFH-SH190041]